MMKLNLWKPRQPSQPEANSMLLCKGHLKKVKITDRFFKETLNSSDIAKGKKLGFIAQEMGREINTLGSKANDADIQHRVVNMKECLEKIKEQVLNVL